MDLKYIDFNYIKYVVNCLKKIKQKSIENFKTK